MSISVIVGVTLVILKCIFTIPLGMILRSFQIMHVMVMIAAAERVENRNMPIFQI